jgi:membrane protein insertase Oxa1/YidC/SpoIIIJ
MMQVGFGAMPPGLMFNLIKGIDIVVVVTGPMLLGWSHWISVVIVGIVVFALSGRFNTEEMQQMQADLQKERQAQKGSGGPRQRIAPPKR